MSSRSNGIGYLMVLGAVLLFSTIEVVSRYLQAGTPFQGPLGAEQVAALRFILGVAFLLPVVITGKRRRKATLRALRLHMPAMAFLGGVGIFLAFYLFHRGVALSGASPAAVIFSANPVFTALLARLVLGERLEARGWMGIGLGLVGALAAVTGFRFTGLLGREDFLGNALVLGSALCWAVYTVYGKRYAEEQGGLTVSFLSITMGSLFFAVMLTVKSAWKDMAGYHPLTWAWLLYLGVVTVGIGYLLYFGGMRRIEVSRGASLFYVKPVLALLLARLFLGETVTWTLCLATALVALAILMVTHAQPSRTG